MQQVGNYMKKGGGFLPLLVVNGVDLLCTGGGRQGAALRVLKGRGTS